MKQGRIAEHDRGRDTEHARRADHRPNECAPDRNQAIVQHRRFFFIVHVGLPSADWPRLQTGSVLAPPRSHVTTIAN